jgi:hypothetical protein
MKKLAILFVALFLAYGCVGDTADAAKMPDQAFKDAFYVEGAFIPWLFMYPDKRVFNTDDWHFYWCWNKTGYMMRFGMDDLTRLALKGMFFPDEMYTWEYDTALEMCGFGYRE